MMADADIIRIFATVRITSNVEVRLVNVAKRYGSICGRSHLWGAFFLFTSVRLQVVFIITSRF